jgi:hypothetical protein
MEVYMQVHTPVDFFFEKQSTVLCDSKQGVRTGLDAKVKEISPHLPGRAGSGLVIIRYYHDMNILLSALRLFRLRNELQLPGC